MDNLYEVEDINGVSMRTWNKNADEVRKDFECSRPNDHIKRIRRVL